MFSKTNDVLQSISSLIGCPINACMQDGLNFVNSACADHLCMLFIAAKDQSCSFFINCKSSATRLTRPCLEMKDHSQRKPDLHLLVLFLPFLRTDVILVYRDCTTNAACGFIDSVELMVYVKQVCSSRQMDDIKISYSKINTMHILLQVIS